MENRVEYTEYDETNPLLQARHRMESRYTIHNLRGRLITTLGQVLFENTQNNV